MRRVVLGVVLVVAWTAVPGFAAVDELLGRPVVSVRVDVEGRVTTEPEIVEVIETRVGRPLVMSEARESVSHLFSLGRFEDVRLHADPSGQGVALRYELVPIHHVARMEFRGKLSGVDEGELRRAVVDRYGLSPAVGRADEVATQIRDTLRQNGFLHPAATPSVELQHDPDRATLVFTIDPGPRTVIGTVEVVGTPAVPAPQLLDKLKLTRGKPYDRQAIDDRIDQYVQSRRARGFYEARIVPAVHLNQGDRIADMTLTVTDGQRVRIAFTGDPVPGNRREDLVPVKREGSVNEDLLEDSSHGIEEYLRGEGYRDAHVTYSREQKERELVISFDVHHGPQYRVDTVEVSGNASVPLATLAPLLHVREGQPFVAANVDADAAAIENLYRREGFTAVHVQSAVDVQSAASGVSVVPVAVRLAIREGVRTVVGSITVDGNATVPGEKLLANIGLQPGRPFFAPQMAADRDAIEVRYDDLGYQNASVEANPGLTADGATANIMFTVHEGQRIFVDHILIVGNLRTSTATIQRELQLKPGDPLSTSAVTESQRRLASLGLFRRVRIVPLGHGGETTRDLLVTVEESPATTIGYGGGFEVQRLPTGLGTQQFQFAPRTSFSIGRRNLFGKNRSVDLFTSLAVLPTDPAELSQGYGFYEYRLIGTFREPRVFDTAADAYLTGTVEQQRRASFDFSRQAVTFDVGRHLTRTVSVTGGYQFQTVKLFNTRYAIAGTFNPVLIDRVFPQVRLSLFSAGVIRDKRDDPVDPTSGTYLSANGELAGRAIGSEVGFAKTFMTAQAFKRMPGARRIVFAGAARLGVATGFPRLVTTTEGDVLVPRIVKDLPASERFFAGGDTTVRGFALDSLGTPATISPDGYPEGGNGLVILNGETRVTVRGGFGVVGFIDTGNVFQNATDIALGDVRTAAGFGIRYKSPIGPLRVDLGFNLHPALINGQREKGSQLWISLGQAF